MVREVIFIPSSSRGVGDVKNDETNERHTGYVLG